MTLPSPMWHQLPLRKGRRPGGLQVRAERWGGEDDEAGETGSLGAVREDARGRGAPWHMCGGESAGLHAASPGSVVLRITTASAYQVPGTALGW